VPEDCTESDMKSLYPLFHDAADFNNVTDISVNFFSVSQYVDNVQGSIKAGEAIIWVIILVLGGGIVGGTLIHLTKL